MLSEAMADNAKRWIESLNPCCNGICSLSPLGDSDIKELDVLILVVMEYAL